MSQRRVLITEGPSVVQPVFSSRPLGVAAGNPSAAKFRKPNRRHKNRGGRR